MSRAYPLCINWACKKAVRANGPLFPVIKNYIFIVVLHKYRYVIGFNYFIDITYVRLLKQDAYNA